MVTLYATVRLRLRSLFSLGPISLSRLPSYSDQLSLSSNKVLRQHSQSKLVKNLLACSVHMYGGNAGITKKTLPSPFLINQRSNFRNPACSMMVSKALYSSEARTNETSPTDAAKELYDKLLKSVKEQRSAPPNSWLWSLIEKCGNHEDIKLLFNILETLRKFRLSNLRIFENFNDNLCREISKACVRVEAIDFAKKTLWKHNVYGLTPNVASAHSLLLYAKEHKDTNLMVDVMRLLKANDMPLQPGTADIVLSICDEADNWDLMSKYTKRFIMSGVKLRRTSFDTWMTFSAKRGDVDNLWKIEQMRSVLMKSHTIGSGFSCAKGLLLERKPKEAAAVIQVVTQTLSGSKRPDIVAELQKMVSEWPLEVIKHRKDDDKKALAVGLQEDIPAMVDSLSSFGLKVKVQSVALAYKST